MPASRQRTENWLKCLWQIFERNGALEISLPTEPDDHDHSPATATNLIWRVRILGIQDDEIVVESPCALGKSIHLDDGIQLVVAIVIGQNRWMFNSTILGHTKHKLHQHKYLSAIRLHLPPKVERCGRRNTYRVSTTELTLPNVRCWSLIDPASAAVAEHANEELVRLVNEKTTSLQETPPQLSEITDACCDDDNFITQLALPEVGPPFDAALANIGGGGIGLVVEADSASALASNRIFYLQFALPPEIPVPLALTAKLVHTHIDSAQRTYAGLAFDFSRNKSHESFIAEQLERYINLRQATQSNNTTTSRRVA